MDKSKKLKYLLPIRCVVFLLIFAAGAAITGKSLDSIVNWWSIAATCVNIALLIFLFLFTRKNGGFAALINYKKGVTKPRQIVLVSLLIVVVGMAGMYAAGFICYGVLPYAAPMMIAPVPARIAVINLILLPVTTALAEDSLYLGCGVNQIERKPLAIIVPAFFFALQHSFIPTLPDARYMSYRFLSFLPLTVILCAYYHKKRDPLPIMIGHAVIDMATAVQILLTSVIPGFYDMMCSL